MTTSTRQTDVLLRTLADFRFELRQFLSFSEQAALEVGLHPQQHQLLLQVAGAPQGISITIAYAAGRLRLKHNSVVELVNRSEKEGLLKRRRDAEDARQVTLQLTAKGSELLRRLTHDHARELNDLAPRLIDSLRRVQSPEILPGVEA